MNFEGIYTPVITPFNEDFSIDRQGFATVLEFLIGAGVNGIVVSGTTGEYYAQTIEERVELTRFAKEVISGKLPLIVGTGAIRTEDSIILAEAARTTGADALMINSPPYALPTEGENAQHALAIDKAADLPIILYNYPGRTGVGMGETYLQIVSQSENFCAIKESSGDIGRLHLLANEYPTLQLSCGMDDQALEFFAWGARSWVAGASNFLPQEHYALYHACAVEKDFDKGRRIMTALLPLMKALEQGGKFVQSIKFGCELQGMFAGSVRKPLRGLTKEMRREFEVTVEVVQTTIANILAESDSAN